MAFAFANVSSVSAQDFNILLNPRECLELENTSQQTNVRIKIAPCDKASTTQRFQVVRKKGTGFVNIKFGNNRCVEINSAQTQNGVDVTQFACDNSSEQAFRLKNGVAPTNNSQPITGQISFSHSGKCFDARNYPWIQQFPCDSSATRRQTFQIKAAPKISPNSQFLNKWDKEISQKLPVTIGQVQLTETTTFCSIGCDCDEPDESKSTMTVFGWTPKLVKGSKMIAEAKAIKPALLVDYCRSGAVQKNINLSVWIDDMNKNNSFAEKFEYLITPKDCSTGINTQTSEDQLWKSIANSRNRQDFVDYLNRFGQNGKYAPIARLRLRQIPPKPTNTSGGSIEDQYWDNVKNSQNKQDFQDYLSRFGQSGKYAPIANLRIRQLNGKPTPKPTPGNNTNSSIEDQYWNTVKNSKNHQDFQDYLNRFGQNGKYAPIAELRIRQLKRNNPTQTTSNTFEDRYWNTVKNSQDKRDFQSYLNRFGQSGKYASLAREKIEDLYWKNIENSRNAKDFQDYLKEYPNGKYVSLARLKIRQNPTQEQLDERFWNNIETSQDQKDFDDYLNKFPNGKHKRLARLKRDQLIMKKETDDFLLYAKFGSLNEISNVRRVFVNATGNNSRNRIIRDLQKKIPSLAFVRNKQDADFFIEYKLTVSSACDPGTSTAVNACELHTGRMWVYKLGLKGTGNEHRRILWTSTKSKSYSSAGANLFTKNPAAQAAGDLIKSLRNLGF